MQKKTPLAFNIDDLGNSRNHHFDKEWSFNKRLLAILFVDKPLEIEMGFVCSQGILCLFIGHFYARKRKQLLGMRNFIWLVMKENLCIMLTNRSKCRTISCALHFCTLLLVLFCGHIFYISRSIWFPYSAKFDLKRKKKKPVFSKFSITYFRPLAYTGLQPFFIPFNERNCFKATSTQSSKTS